MKRQWLAFGLTVGCPGGPAINHDREKLVAQCPHCDYTFSTLMDEPVVPPHYVSQDGTVMFRLRRGRSGPER